MLFRHAAGLAPANSNASGQVVVERPPSGLARGSYATSPAAVALLGAALVLGTLIYFVFRSKEPRT